MPASQRPFMGATPYDAGVTFRVWAPFATGVSVAGDFNAWSTTANRLFSENNGYWSVDVPGARVGNQYKFNIVDAAKQPPWRNDPYARSMVHSNGSLNSVIAATDANSATPGYSTLPWNEMVIYELHIGSFVFEPRQPSWKRLFRGRHRQARLPARPGCQRPSK